MSAAELTRSSRRRKTNPLTAEQEVEKTVTSATRYRNGRLIVEQNAENVRIEIERRNAESLQAEVVRLLNLRNFLFNSICIKFTFKNEYE